MRKKRKERARAAEAAELESPEVNEALAAEALVEGDEASDPVAAAEPDADPDADSGSEPDADAEADADVWAEEAAETAEAAEATPAEGLSDARLEVIIESLLFAAERPLALTQLRSLTGVRALPRIEAALAALGQRYQGRGIVLHDVAGGFQLRTDPTCSEYVQELIAGRPVRLSRAQLETLAIIAYRQPITRPEIDEIRGVDSGSTLKVLSDRELIRVLGKKEEPGRPLLYGTTREFLEFFHLKDLRELPTLREFHELSEDSLREVERHDRASQDASQPVSVGTTNSGGGDDDALAREIDDTLGDDGDSAEDHS